MSNKKPDISQIKKYLQNELDAQAMHQLERNAQDDPFLAEAMEGFENAATDQQANYADLQKRLAGRIEPAKECNIWLWRVLPLAACLLIALLIGYWYLSPKPPKQQLADVVKPEKAVSKADTMVSVKKLLKQNIAKVTEPKLRIAKGTMLAQQTLTQPSKDSFGAKNTHEGIVLNNSPKITYKADTVEYTASDYKVRQNAKVDDLLKHMEGFDVDSGGNVTHQGQPITKVRLSGRDYAGGNIQQAVKSLPADIVEKVQVIDDYGDQAPKTGVKSGDPRKVLNVTTDSNKRKLIANSASASPMQLNEVVVAKVSTPMGPVNIAVNAIPLIGTKAFNNYLIKNAVMPNGETGEVEVGFTVGSNGSPENIHVIASNNDVLNGKAIDLISKGSKWKKWSEESTQEAHIKIKFSKL